MDINSFVLFLIYLFLGWYYTKYHRILAIASKLPGPKSWPFIGNSYIFILRKPTDFLEKLTAIGESFPKIACLMIGACPEILITDPKYAEAILSSQKLIDKADEYSFLEDWIGTGLFTSTTKKWFTRRKIITPAFHFKILNQFIEIFDKHGRSLTQKLENSKGKPIDVYELVKLYALDNICESAMGIDIQAQINSNSNYVRAVRDASGLLSKRMFTFYLRPNFIFNLTSHKRKYDKLLKEMHDFIDNVIVSRRAELMKSNENENKSDQSNEDIGVRKKMNFLDILLHSTIDGASLSNIDIREEVNTFMFAGHDGTSSTIALCLYNLAKYPKNQQTAYEEVVDILGDDLESTISINHLNDLKYIEMVIKETLRLYPSLPLIGRKIKEDLLIGEHLIPKGANIGISAYFMGRDPTLWNDPLTFDPERFSSDKQMSHPYLYIPFSAGPRNCIGQRFAMLELKSVISKILRNFEISVAPNFQPLIVSELVLKSENGIWLEFRKRSV